MFITHNFVNACVCVLWHFAKYCSYARVAERTSICIFSELWRLHLWTAISTDIHVYTGIKGFVGAQLRQESSAHS
uniref:Uncharacterized protein n=1 Tax=Anguilla anguilla TaxID=7936 RepID=A0A0E9X6V7_ANGAN